MAPKVRQCSAQGCNNAKTQGDGQVMCSFPLDKTRQRKFVQAAGNEDLLGLTALQVHQNFHLCSDHFEAKYFTNKFCTKLYPGIAVPTLFDHPPLSDEQMLRYNNPHVHFFTGPSLEAMDVDDVVMVPLPLPHSAAVPDEEPEEVDSPGKKRPRTESPEEVDDVDPLYKNPRLDLPQPSTPRRPLESLGARERDGSRRTRMSREQIGAMSGVSQMTSDCRAIARTALEYRQMAIKCRKKLDKCMRNIKATRKLAKKKFIDMVEEFTLTPAAKVILKGEMKNLKRKPKGHRWSLHDKLLWLAVYKRSPAVYRFLCLHLCLPSESTLKALLKEVVLEPGLSEPFMKILRKKVELMSEKDKHVVLLFDEIFLRGRLIFNDSQKIVKGFENYGQRGRTNLVADHAMVFMVQGVHSKWTQPVAFYFVNKTCPTAMLKLLIQDVVRAVTSLGLNVLGTVSDQGPTNRAAISELRKDCGDSILYKVDGKYLVHLWDIPHIIKNIRNNLLSSDLEFGDKKLAKWRHLITFFQLDQTLCSMTQLTLKHLNPQGRDKMRVSLAAQVFSATVAKLMRVIFNCSDETKLKDCMDFSDLCHDIDFYFDLCNGPRSIATSEKVKEQRTNVTPDSLHHVEWQKMYTSLQKWTFIRKSDGSRHVPFCVLGWMENLKSYRVLCKKIFRDSRPLLKVLKLRNLNQDALENFFCLVRQCCGSSTDLTCSQFIGAVKPCLISRFSKLVTSHKNCIEDGAFFLNDLSEFLISREGEDSGVDKPPTQVSLIRGDTPANFGRRVRSEVQNPVHRQGPTRLWSSVLPTLSSSLKCDACLKLLTTSTKSKDTLFCNLTSAFDLYPSQKLVTLFISLQNTFESMWKKILHLDDAQAAVKGFCINSVSWGTVFCSEHQQQNCWDIVVDKVVFHLISLKCKLINQQIKDGVSRRTRQALSFKNHHGLYPYEEEMELNQHDLQLLNDGALAQGPVTTIVACATPQKKMSTPFVPLTIGTPSNHLKTPQQRIVPISPAISLASCRTPQQNSNSLASQLTPRQHARAKVQVAWQQPATPSTSRIEPVTPRQIINHIPQADVKQEAPDDSTVSQLIASNTLNKLTIPLLKLILRRRGKTVSGNKGELLKKVVESFQE